MGKYKILYAKHPGQKKFMPVNWLTGEQEVNRIKATMFKPEEMKLVEEDMANPSNKDVQWEWRD